MPETTSPAGSAPGSSTDSSLRTLIGFSTIGFAVVYAVSDLVELAQGGFSQFQLVLTYAGEAAIPLLVLGLYAIQRPHIGRLGLAGAALYSYAYIYFASTVVLALEQGQSDWKELNDQLSPWVALHGAVMVIGGVCFGLATARAAMLPRWIGYAVVAAVCLVAATAAASDLTRTSSALARAAVFVAFGVTALRPLRGPVRLHARNGHPAGPRFGAGIRPTPPVDRRDIPDPSAGKGRAGDRRRQVGAPADPSR